ncbi:hypothetical protein Tco_0631772 [Tanacetum coccineum]
MCRAPLRRIVPFGNALNRAPGQTGNHLALEGSRNNQGNGNRVRGRAYNVNVNAMEAVQRIQNVRKRNGGRNTSRGCRINKSTRDRSVGIAKALKSAKEDELKLNDILVVREFKDVFPEDLSGLPRTDKMFTHEEAKSLPMQPGSCENPLKELYNDDLETGSCDCVADALSRKERFELQELLRAMALTVIQDYKERIQMEETERGVRGIGWPEMKRESIATYVTCKSRLNSSIREDYSTTEKLALIYVDEYSRETWEFPVLPVFMDEIREGSLIGPKLIQETTDKVVLIKEKLKAARDRQKSYADNRRKPLEFRVGDRVMLKNDIKIDKTLRFVEKPVEILDREVKSLKRSRIALVKVRWESKRGPEFTWEREDYMKTQYSLSLFVDRDNEIDS